MSGIRGTEINESEPAFITEDAEPPGRARIKASQIAGVPWTHTISLLPIQLTEGVLPCVTPASGLWVGTSVKKSGTIDFMSPVLPQMRYQCVHFVVEFTDYDKIPDETFCRFEAVYMDRSGTFRALRTNPLSACGDQFRFNIPATQVRSGYVLPLSLKIELLSEDDQGQPRPILVRGCWLEFPAND